MESQMARNGVVTVKVQARLLEIVQSQSIAVEKKHASKNSILSRDSFLKKREFFEKRNLAKPTEPPDTTDVAKSESLLSPVTLARTREFVTPSTSGNKITVSASSSSSVTSSPNREGTSFPLPVKSNPSRKGTSSLDSVKNDPRTVDRSSPLSVKRHPSIEKKKSSLPVSSTPSTWETSTNLSVESELCRKEKSYSQPARSKDETSCLASVATDSSREMSSQLAVRSNPREDGRIPSQSARWDLIETNGQAAMKMTRPQVEKSRKHLEELEASITTSTDNLLRQMVLAVQVLNKLPRAWRRISLNGGIDAESLLGKVELERALPLKEVSIHVATWNMNGKEPPHGLKPWLLPEEITDVPDILVVGTQESYPEDGDWETLLQEIIGPSHVMFYSNTFGTLRLSILIRKELIWFLSVADEDTHSVRIGSAFRTKGAIAVAFYLFGTTFLFITSHLTAHTEKLKERHEDIRHIVKGLKLPHKLPCRHREKDVTDNFDNVFWSGDLNFRLTRPRSEIIDWVSSENFPLTGPAPGGLDDQLINSIEDGSILRDFKEGPLTFAPTYKFDPGTSMYDTSSRQRTPSYTDRILFKTNRVGSYGALKCTGYGSVPSICTSDHKPVWGRYRCPIQPGIDT